MICCHCETIISSLLVASSEEIKIESVRELLVDKKYKIIGFSSELDPGAYLTIVQSIVLKSKLSEGEVNRSMYKYDRDFQRLNFKSRDTQMGNCDAAY